MDNIKFLYIVFLVCFLQGLSGQSRFVSGLFPTIDHSGRITKDLDYSLYYFGAFPLINLRKLDKYENVNFLLFYAEQALTYNVNNQLSFTGSYVYQRENVSKDNYLNENRIHVQATYKHKQRNLNLKHRLRFDNRFVKGNVFEEVKYSHRLRYLVGIDFPIKSKINNLYFTAYEEGFFNTYKNAAVVFGENWAYAAIGVKLNEKNKIEAGPLFITWNIGGNNWFNQYYGQVTWISHLDFNTSK